MAITAADLVAFLCGFFAAWALTTPRLMRRYRRMRAALLMEGAPEAPCDQCKALGNCRACLCPCHRERAEYVSRQHAEALK